MLALILTILMAQPPQVGAIHILVEAGDKILLDSKEMGISSLDAGGMLINNVPVGDHEIIVRTPYGGTATTRARVSFGETTTVSISSLGLRTRARGTDTTIEVQVATEAPECMVRVGLDESKARPAELRIEHIHPGPQKVMVLCGDKRADGDFDIPPGKIVTMTADLSTHKLSITNEQERITSVNVPTVADLIMKMDLPSSWKRAIAATIPPGVRPRSIVQKGMRAEATFVMPDYGAAYTFTSQLKERSEVSSVYVTYYDYTRDGYVFRFMILFRSL